MIDINEFLSAHGGALSDSEQPAVAGTSLGVILLGASGDNVRFGHYGVVFNVDRNAVLGVSTDAPAIPNPFGKGVPCILLLSPDAELTRTIKVMASELTDHLPFGIARPSNIPTIPAASSPREAAWLRSRGLELPSAEAATTTYTRTDSAQTTATHSATQSNGFSDDSAVDDTPSDPMPSDDANADDMSGDQQAVSAAASSTYTRTDSSQTTSTATTTQSNGLADDSAVDDSPSDSMANDDANVDD